MSFLEYKISIQLTSTDKNTVAFSQEWNTEVAGSDIMCPLYSSEPDENEHPRKLIMDSLVVDNPKVAKESFRYSKHATGSLLSEESLSITDIEDFNNFNCPNNIGYLNSTKLEEIKNEDKVFYLLPRPYQINQTFYFPRTFSNSICSGSSTYLYRLEHRGKQGKNLKIVLSKRSQSDFYEDWYVSMEIKGLGGKTKRGYQNIISIEEKDNQILLDLFDFKTGKLFKIEAVRQEE